MADITITITIPQTKAIAIINAFADQHGYKSVIDGVPNPQNKKAYSLDIIEKFIRDSYRAGKVKELSGAITTVKSDADAYTKDLTVS